jgi:hypothetical protein
VSAALSGAFDLHVWRGPDAEREAVHERLARRDAEFTRLHRNGETLVLADRDFNGGERIDPADAAREAAVSIAAWTPDDDSHDVTMSAGWEDDEEDYERKYRVIDKVYRTIDEVIRGLKEAGVRFKRGENLPRWVDRLISAYRPEGATDAEWHATLRRVSGNTLAFVAPGKATFTDPTADPADFGEGLAEEWSTRAG